MLLANFYNKEKEISLTQEDIWHALSVEEVFKKLKNQHIWINNAEAEKTERIWAERVRGRTEIRKAGSTA